MNIEQIAHEVAQETDWKDAAEFLRRCLSKLAEQDAEPVGYIKKDKCNLELIWTLGMLKHFGLSPTDLAIEPLYTEAQLLAAQQRTAEACAKACEAGRSEDGDGQHPAWYAGIDMCIDAIRNGEWMEYL